MSCETLFPGPYEFVLYDFFFFEIKIRTRIWMHAGSEEPWDMRGWSGGSGGCWSGAEEAGLDWRLIGQLLAEAVAAARGARDGVRVRRIQAGIPQAFDTINQNSFPTA